MQDQRKRCIPNTLTKQEGNTKKNQSKKYLNFVNVFQHIPLLINMWSVMNHIFLDYNKDAYCLLPPNSLLKTPPNETRDPKGDLSFD